MSEITLAQMCLDPRFRKEAEKAVEKLVGDDSTVYFQTIAGGAAAEQDLATENIVVEHGGKRFVWGAHGDGCKRFPGLSDEEVAANLDKQIKQKVEKYPDSEHYRLFATLKGVDIKRVK